MDVGAGLLWSAAHAYWHYSCGRGALAAEHRCMHLLHGTAQHDVPVQVAAEPDLALVLPLLIDSWEGNTVSLTLGCCDMQAPLPVSAPCRQSCGSCMHCAFPCSMLLFKQMCSDMAAAWPQAKQGQQGAMGGMAFPPPQVESPLEPPPCSGSARAAGASAWVAVKLEEVSGPTLT